MVTAPPCVTRKREVRGERVADGILASALVRDPSQYPTLLHAARESLRSLSAEIDLKLTALG